MMRSLPASMICSTRCRSPCSRTRTSTRSWLSSTPTGTRPPSPRDTVSTGCRGDDLVPAASCTHHTRGKVPMRTSNWRRSLGLAPIAVLALVLYAAFLLYPLIQSVFTSLTDRNPLKPESDFVGFANYLELFTDQRL